jgi:hypothetical protein
MKAAHSDRQPEPVKLSGSAGAALALELRHLRYFVALAERGFALRIQRSAAPALAADEPRLRCDRGLAHRGADRPQRHLRKPAQADPATRSAVTHEMARVVLEHRPLVAKAALVWSGDLSRTLQQILFDTAESIISPGPAQQVEPALQAMSFSLASWPGAVRPEFT